MGRQERVSQGTDSSGCQEAGASSRATGPQGASSQLAAGVPTPLLQEDLLPWAWPWDGSGASVHPR